MRLLLIPIFLALISFGYALAQSADTCPALVQTALEVTKEGCVDTGTNQACYGYLVLEAKSQPGITDFEFEQPGDIVNVTDVQNLRLSSMDVKNGRWGVALMQIEASLLPGELDEVTFVLFGDVAVNNALQIQEVTANSQMNIRSIPSTNGDIMGRLEADQTTVANGRTSDSSWLRVQIPDAGGANGWVFTELITTSGELESLEVVDASSTAEATDIRPQFGPMQAFYFETGTDDAPCAESPNSGLLIQTPEGAAEVSLWMNEVVIRMDATAFIQADAGGTMNINVIEGSVEVEAFGETHIAVAGTQIKVPIDENLAATGAPGEPQSIEDSILASLPISLLDREVTIPAPLEVRAGVPIGGNWHFNWSVDALQCDNGRIVNFETVVTDTLLFAENDGATVILLGAQYTRTQQGVYSAVFTDAVGNLHRSALRIVSTDRILGEANIEFIGLDCTLQVPFQLSLASR